MIDIPDITLTYAVSIALCVLGFAGMVIVRVVPMGQAGRYVDPFGVILMCVGLLVVLYGAFWQIPQIENRNRIRLRCPAGGMSIPRPVCFSCPVV